MRRFGAQRGFTLIEIIIVILIMASAMTAVALGTGATRRSNLRSSCFILVSAMRFAYSRAVTQGNTVRLVMDFEKRTIQLQETKGRVVLNKEDETGTGLRREDDEEYYDEDGGLVNVSLGSRLDSIGSSLTPIGQGGLAGGPAGGMMGGMGGMGGMGMNSGGGMGRLVDPFLISMQAGGNGGGTGNPAGYRGPKFEPLEGRKGEARKLKGSSAFKLVYSPHEPVPREDGRAYVYFFPGGLTEHVVVQVSDGDEDEPRIYSIELHPLTGRAKVINSEYEPEEALDNLQEADE